jgi:hypothetical protein
MTDSPFIFNAYKYDDLLLWMAVGCDQPPTVELIEPAAPVFDAPKRNVPMWPSDQP